MIVICILLIIILIFLYRINSKINYIQDKVMDSGNKVELLWHEYLIWKHNK
jgi:predicted Holliday junction resolvase-like endonuclease